MNYYNYYNYFCLIIYEITKKIQFLDFEHWVDTLFVHLNDTFTCTDIHILKNTIFGNTICFFYWFINWCIPKCFYF